MEHKINSKNTILQCALELFGERGYESVGITEITQQAGVTKPTLYYFFQSKEGVFRAILDEYYERFNRLLQKECTYEAHPEVYHDDVFPVLKRVVNSYFAYARENTTFYLMLLSLSFAPPTALTTTVTQPYIAVQYKTVTALFKEIAEHHHNLEGKEQQCACNFIAMINANIGFWYQGTGELDDKKAESIVQQFMHGMFAG